MTEFIEFAPTQGESLISGSILACEGWGKDRVVDETLNWGDPTGSGSTESGS